jgi:DNA-directed RNA polymerase specialized sigma24 family protein
MLNLAREVLADRDHDGSFDEQDLVAEAFLHSMQRVDLSQLEDAALMNRLRAVMRTVAAALSGSESGIAPLTSAEVARLEKFGSPEEATVTSHRNVALLGTFETLPIRWQTILWRTAVSKEPAVSVGDALHMTSGNVTLIAHRARLRLRKAWVAQDS